MCFIAYVSSPNDAPRAWVAGHFALEVDIGGLVYGSACQVGAKVQADAG